MKLNRSFGVPVAPNATITVLRAARRVSRARDYRAEGELYGALIGESALVISIVSRQRGRP